MPFAESHSARLHYTVRGRGTQTVLLIPGFGCCAGEWGEEFLAYLARDLRVICMDNRGVGDSRSDTPNWRMEDMAADVCAVLNAAGIERAHIAGASMGGLIAQRIACTAPARAISLILISTSLPYCDPEVKPPNDEAIAAFCPQLGVSKRDRHLQLLRVLTSPGFVDRNPELIERLVETRVRARIAGTVVRTQGDAMFEGPYGMRASPLHVPVLVVHGEDDALTPIANGRGLAARCPGARTAWLARCGHYPYLERPLESARQIVDFVSSSAQLEKVS
jgi:3-oxoadipate enol-lactonase